jgi:NAD(P)-dependent dehydrogenase (short-subunit alcohol dehydrogenase family)
MAKKPVALVTGGSSGIGLALTTVATVNRRS